VRHRAHELAQQGDSAHVRDLTSRLVDTLLLQLGINWARDASAPLDQQASDEQQLPRR
jgi:hypothetical protein